jgi:hypothetical protein
MRRGPRNLVLIMAVLGLLAAGCSKPAKKTSAASKGASSGGNNVTGAPGVTTPGGVTGSTVAGGAAPGATPSAASTGFSAGVSTGQGGAGTNIGNFNSGDVNQAKLVGSQISPQSTARRLPYSQGVTDNQILVDYSYDQTTCGINPNAAIVAAGGLLPTPTRFFRPASSAPSQVAKDKQDSVANDVRFFNDHAFDLFSFAPNVRKYMGNDPANQFFGRHLVYKMIDGGSFECPDKTTAAAKQAAEQDKVFAVLEDDSLEGSAYNMDAALNAEPGSRRPMDFGILWPSDQTMNQFAPYDWTQFATGSTIVRQQAEWICTRLKGQKAKNSTDTVLQNSTRKFGLVHSNLPEMTLLANEFKTDLKNDCGSSPIAKEVVYNGGDISAQQQDAINIAVQLKTAGITSVINLTDVLFPVFELAQASAQSYYPEWVWSSFGLADASQVQRVYDSGNCGKGAAAHCEVRGSMGISELGVFGGFAYDAGDSFNSWHIYHQVDPATGWHCDPTSDNGMSNGGKEDGFCKAPSVQATIYYVFLPFIGGLGFAGPDLTVNNVTNGLQHYPLTRYGGHGPTSDPRPALVHSGTGHYGFIADAVEWKWHPEWTSPPPENKPGFVEYPDCERHYLDWPNGLAPGWEVNGPNWTKYCGVNAPGLGGPDYPAFYNQPGP